MLSYHDNYIRNICVYIYIIYIYNIYIICIYIYIRIYIYIYILYTDTHTYIYTSVGIHGIPVISYYDNIMIIAHLAVGSRTSPGDSGLSHLPGADMSPAFFLKILWMEEILHQLIGGLSHYL